MATKSLFITFEGGEGAGKSTLIDRIYDDLSSRALKPLKTRAPGGTKTGEAIRHILLHKEEPISPRCELLLFLADRAQHVEEIITPALKKGQIVLCDRFSDSTVAYQGGARGFDKAWIKKLCEFAASNVTPSLTIYLDLDPKIGFERRQKGGFTKDRIESEDIQFHQKIRNAFHEIAKEEPKRFHIIDASKSPENVFSQAMVLINALL